jgi:hypothetical protein
VACDFNDPYAEVVENRMLALGDCWADSGINALSVVARFVTVDRLVGATGTLPLCVRAVFSGHDGAQPVRVSIAATWTSSSSAKTTTLTFADKTTIVLNHSTATAQITDSSAAPLVHRFGHRPLGERYGAMFASYAADDPLKFSRDTQDALHAHLYAAAEQLRAI